MFNNRSKIGVFSKSITAAVIVVIVAGYVWASNSKIQQQYDLSINYYEKIKEQGAKVDELLAVLSRIIEKYKLEGIDLTAVAEEKKRLEQLKSKLPVQSIAANSLDTAASADYKIDIGDMLNISVYPANELSQNVVVQPDGKIVMPMIGEVLARGLTKNELKASLLKKLKVYVAGPEVNITLQSSSKRKIFLMGEVRRPGSYDFQEGMRLIEFISKNGGLSEKADLINVKVYRGDGINRKVFELNLDEVYKTGDFSKDFTIMPADVIEIGKTAKDIYVIGEVISPGSYQHKPGLKLLELITLSGGFTDDALTTKVKVFRGETPNIEVFEINMAKVLDKNRFDLDIKIEAGDTVYVQKQGFAKTTSFIDRLAPWMTLLNFGLMIALISI